MNNLEFVEEIKLSEVFGGKKVTRIIERNSICAQCKGTGSDDGKQRMCKMCCGRKCIQQQRRMGQVITIQQIPCPQCRGTSVDNGEHLCSKCKGTKLSRDKHTIYYEIPIGQMDHEVIMIRGEGNISPENLERGDIIIKILILQDETFLRNLTIDGKQMTPIDLEGVQKFNIRIFMP